MWGLEIANDGSGERYTDEQLAVIDAVALAFHQVDGVRVELICAHHEWAPQRKIDPAVDPAANEGSWHMGRFRDQLRTQKPDEPTSVGEDDMIELWTGPDPERTDDDTSHRWLVQRAPLVAALTSEGHLGVYTRLGPDEYAHWAKLAERSDRPDVLEAEARASRSWFRDARLKRV